MAVNKVIYGTTVLVDLTEDTVTPSALAEGYTAHDRSGAPITGTATGGSMVIRDEQDSHGGTIRSITAGSVVTGTKTITANGTYDVAEFADASVNVPAPEPELQAKTATPSTSQQVITADSGYDGLSQVTVSAMPSGSASTPATSITANPSISVNSSTGLITASVSGSKSVTPSVSAGYVSSGTAGTVSVSGSNTSQLTTQAAKTVTPSTSSQTAVAAGRYTTGAVTVAAMPSGTAGTPTATKGTVSNHVISVTPSVTNTTGYITGGTKTGTAVTVSASELVSGSQTITENGTVDVTNLASVDVDVAASSNVVVGTFEFDSAGTKTVTIPYTGSGYPLLIDICVTNVENNTDWQELVAQYKVEHIVLSKVKPWTEPTYSRSDDNTGGMMGLTKYKNSSTIANSFSFNSDDYHANLSMGGPDASYPISFVTMSSATSLKVMVNYSKYSVAMNINYTYRIVYSE